MKKLKDVWEAIFLLFVIGAIFSSYGAGKAAKASKLSWTKFLIAVLVGVLLIKVGCSVYENSLPVQDCVPATLHRVFPERSYEEIVKLCKTERTGTELTNLVSVWKSLSTNELTPVYSVFPTIKAKEEGIQFDHPYLWIGEYDGGNHCALVKFSSTDVKMSHSQFLEGSTNYYLVGFDYKSFFEKTFIIYSSEELKKSIRLY